MVTGGAHAARYAHRCGFGADTPPCHWSAGAAYFRYPDSPPDRRATMSETENRTQDIDATGLDRRAFMGYFSASSLAGTLFPGVLWAQFGGGPVPPLPFPNCGADSTEDDLDCASFSGC